MTQNIAKKCIMMPIKKTVFLCVQRLGALELLRLDEGILKLDFTFEILFTLSQM